MIKGIIVFLLSVFILALVVGKCNSSENDVYDENVEHEQIFFPNSSSNIQDRTNSPDEKKPTGEIESPQEDALTIGYLEATKINHTLPSQILFRKGYILSYNNVTKNPNWVAWHLTKEHSDGCWSRRGIPYMEDLDAIQPRQEPSDWKNNPNGYDHGHMCPAGDNKWSDTAMIETFYLTNFCPQNRALNGGDWKELEEACREWAIMYRDIYIVCGPIYYSEEQRTLGGSKQIWIPDAFFKVVLCMNGNPKAIGFKFPNVGNSHPLQYYSCTVDDIENTTGFDFFSLLPDDIEDQVEKQNNLLDW